MAGNRLLSAVTSLVLIGLHLTSAEERIALIIIDVQNCFVSGGTLAVQNGSDVIPVINNIRKKHNSDISLTVLSQDWHCVEHVSFASQHSGYELYSTINLLYDNQANLCEEPNTCDVVHNVTQVLWPDHCVINTTDAAFVTSLNREADDILIQKGYNCDVDSYSAFYDNGGFTHTDLDSILKANGITKVLVTGLALDYCVYYTSKDAKMLGYNTYFILDATRAVTPANIPTVLQDLRTKGVHVIDSSQIDSIVSGSQALRSMTSLMSLVLVGRATLAMF